ncbi:Protein of unknown function [Gryllus bimaculatus]|nr:Protein of unknown function [Gryllus bimaculatus]
MLYLSVWCSAAFLRPLSLVQGRGLGAGVGKGFWGRGMGGGVFSFCVSELRIGDELFCKGGRITLFSVTVSFLLLMMDVLNHGWADIDVVNLDFLFDGDGRISQDRVKGVCDSVDFYCGVEDVG